MILHFTFYTRKVTIEERKIFKTMQVTRSYKATVVLIACSAGVFWRVSAF